MSFVHLHCHSDYSLLDSLVRISPLVARAAALGQPALALTDHNAMCGVIPFYRAARKAGIKPILGLECDLIIDDIQRPASVGRGPFHVLLLARNMKGYANLVEISTAALLQQRYGVPAIDCDTLINHASGLICTTGCMRSEIGQLIQSGADRRLLYQTLGWYRDLFGADNFFLELQNHGRPEQQLQNEALIDLQGHVGARVVATNDVHYVHETDHEAYQALRRIRFRGQPAHQSCVMDGASGHHLRSHMEMEKLFEQVPSALHNTLLIAEMCDVNPLSDAWHLPVLPTLSLDGCQEYLRNLCEKSLEDRYGTRANDREIRDRLAEELAAIEHLGFASILLIYWDVCAFARQRGISWSIFGSAGSSIVTYLLNITELDPLEHDLVFARFLNRHRVTAPDIDLYFQSDRLGEVVQHIIDRFGEDHVARFASFGVIGGRQAIRDAARALKIKQTIANRVLRLLPTHTWPGRRYITDLVSSLEFSKIYESNSQVRRLIDVAASLEGLHHHLTVHRCGLVIGPEPLVQHQLPLQSATRWAKKMPVSRMTQFEYFDVESLGFVKVDLLNAPTLAAMQNACRLIEASTGMKFTLDSLPTDDPAAFALMAKGDTAGIWQIRGEGIRRVLMEMRPSSLSHVVAALSLYRPGPMEFIPQYIRRMHGEEPVEYLHPDLKPILEETYGIVVFQEQVIQIALQIAGHVPNQEDESSGYTPAEADLLRRAMSKKTFKTIQDNHDKFVSAAVLNGYLPSVGQAVYDALQGFSRYGFNKAHAINFARITCQAAFLKAHYPVEFLAAFISQMDFIPDRRQDYIAEAHRIGISVLPPDLNISEVACTIKKIESSAGDAQGAIRLGLRAIKGVSQRAAETIVDARTSSGLFLDLADFLARVDLRTVGKPALNALINVGAFDSLVELTAEQKGMDSFLEAVELIEDIDKMFAAGLRSKGILKAK